MTVLKSPRLAAVLPMLLTGCAALNTYNNQENNPSEGGGSQTYFIDAKQRAITMSRDDGADGRHGALRVCAEPSPDALSAYAANQGASFSKGELLQAGLNLSLAEGSGSIGLRTQSIQLMRDSMYRLCEAYLSGAISSLAYETLSRRFQSSMVAVLAIEQLTGTVRAPALVLAGGTQVPTADILAGITEKGIKAREGAAKAAADAADLKTKSDEATKEVTALKAEREKLGNDPDVKAPPPVANQSDDVKKKLARFKELEALIPKSEEKEKTAKAASDSAAKASKEALEVTAAYEAARVNLLTGAGTSSVTAVVEAAQPRSVDKETAAVIASNVKDIVLDTINKPFGNELCTTVLIASLRDTASDSLKTQCLAYLTATTAYLTNLNSVIAEQLKLVGTAGNGTDRQRVMDNLSRVIREGGRVTFTAETPE